MQSGKRRDLELNYSSVTICVTLVLILKSYESLVSSSVKRYGNHQVTNVTRSQRSVREEIQLTWGQAVWDEEEPDLGVG